MFSGMSIINNKIFKIRKNPNYSTPKNVYNQTYNALLNKSQNSLKTNQSSKLF